MQLKKYFLIAVGGALVGAGTGFALRTYNAVQVPESPAALASVQEVDEIPAFTFQDLTGRQRYSSEFTNKVVVLNFWATWCAPCRKETPEFVQLQDAFDGEVQFVGIAIDDVEPVREFADSFAVNYPILLGDVDAVAISRRLGNRYQGLPFTVVAAPGGKVVLRHTGGLEREQLEPVLRELTRAG